MGSDPDVIFAGGTFSRISKWSVPSLTAGILAVHGDRQPTPPRATYPPPEIRV